MLTQGIVVLGQPRVLFPGRRVQRLHVGPSPSGFLGLLRRDNLIRVIVGGLQINQPFTFRPLVALPVF